MSTPNVYVINRSSHDFSDAKRFGDLVFLSQGNINRFATNKIARFFAPMIDSSKPDDYILITGLTVMTCIATGMFAYKHGRLNLLIHRANHTYAERRMVFDSLIDTNIPDMLQEALVEESK